MTINGLLLPLPALQPALDFLRDALQLEAPLRDGARYAALAPRELRIALAAGNECIVDAPALVVRVADLASAVQRLRACGATLRRGPDDGPHERRAVLHAAGLDFVISQKTATS
jgi:hypothetical protein